MRAAVVGLLLEVAAEAEHGCLQPDRDHAAPDAEPAEHHAGDRGSLVRAVVDEPVVTGDVGDLVREQRRELIFVLQPRKHAGMHVDVAVRQRECVRRRVAQHVELVLDVVVGRIGSDVVADAADEREHVRLRVEQRVRGEIGREIVGRVDQVLLVVMKRDGLETAACERDGGR